MVKKTTKRIKFSIRAKLTLLIVGLLSVSIISLGALSYRNSKIEMINQFIINSENVADKLNQSLDSFLADNEQNIEMLSNNSNVKDILFMPGEAYASLNSVLRNFQEAHPDIQTVYLGTKTKQMILYPAIGLPEGFDPTSRQWYQDAVKADKLIWTAPYVDAGTGNIVITVAKPVKSTTGELTGVIGADISLNTFMKMVQNTKLGKEGYFTITDLKGNILYHKDSNLIGKPLPVNKLLDFVVKNQGGTLKYEYNGDKKVATTDKNEKTNWMIIGSFSESEINKSAAVIIRAIIISGIIIGILAILFGVFVTSAIITKSLSLLVKDIQSIGSGNFKIRCKVKSNDEIGELAATINSMVENLSEMMRNVMSISSSVASSSDSLAATAQQTNASTEEVVRAIGEVTEAANDQARGSDTGLHKTNELSDSIQQVAENLENISERFSKANELNHKGIDTVKILMEKTDQSYQAAQGVAEVISDVDISTKKIGAITSAIGQIASQTNLLALNASIEAARAGDAGRGFAVVADEIRKLAEQSAQAADQINSLIQDIQGQSEIAVSTMANAGKVVADQAMSVEETKEVFKQISEAIEMINNEISNINKHNSSMLAKKNDITSVMENIASASQQTAASTEEISASTEEQLAIVAEISKTAENLNTLAQRLNDEIKKFEI